MSDQQNGIRLAVMLGECQENRLIRLWDGVLSLLFLGGIILNVNSAMEGYVHIVPILVFGAAIALAMVLVKLSRKTSFLFWVIPAMSALLCLAIFSKAVANGFIITCNELLERTGETLGWTVTQFELIRGASEFDATIFLIFAMAILSLIIVPCIRRGNALLPLVLAIAICVFCCFTGAESEIGILMLLIAATTLVLKKMSHGFDLKNAAISKFFALICLLLICGIVLILGSLGGKVGALSGVHRTVNKSVGKLVYGKSIMPEGDFSDLGDLSLSGEPQLEVVMSKPESYYLRGFVGSVYNSHGWENIESKELYKNSDLFYWLHKDGFYGQTQLSELAKLAGNDEQLNRITIRNVGASKKYVYAPYEVASDDNQLLQANGIGDQVLSDSRLFANKSYTYYAAANQVKKYTSLMKELSDSEVRADGKYSDYLNNEAHYNEYVYSNYTQIPENVNNLIGNLLGEYDSGNEHFDYTQAKQNILKFLTENMTYSEKISACDGDFVSAFLNETKSGYSVHFATAATLMFRYYGIPARYVEGYLIMPDDAEDAAANSLITIDGTHAHAWTEFYQDGVGWIPFETTPEYLDVMEKADDIKGEQSNENKQDNENDTDTDGAKQEQGTSEMIRQNSGRIFNALLLVVLAVAALLVVLAAVILVRRRKRLKAVKKSFESEDVRLAASNMFAYCAGLLIRFEVIGSVNEIYFGKGNLSYYGNEYMQAFDGAFEVYKEAKFSTHEMSDEQREKLLRFTDMTVKAISERRSSVGRFIDRHIRYLY